MRLNRNSHQPDGGCAVAALTQGCVALFSSVSRKEMIRSQVQLSTLGACFIGAILARGGAFASGAVLGDSFGAGILVVRDLPASWASDPSSW